MSNVVEFPDPRGAPQSLDEYEQDLLDLHIRLSLALDRGKPSTRVTLDIDDIMSLCELIEARLGHDFFDNSIA